jgi:hypothetical protein
MDYGLPQWQILIQWSGKVERYNAELCTFIGILQCVVGNLTSDLGIKLHVTQHEIPRRPESSSALWSPQILPIVM